MILKHTFIQILFKGKMKKQKISKTLFEPYLPSGTKKLSFRFIIYNIEWRLI